MRYVFIDLECSNCYGEGGKICEFGYVILNKDFKIKEKNVFVMSPGKGVKNKFNTKVYRKGSNFAFAYPIDYYYSQPEFPHFYNRIRKLLSDKGTVVVGFSIDNDLRYLHYTLNRYNLEEFDFKVIDTQILLSIYENSTKGMTISLQHAYEKYCDNQGRKIIPHLSRDDAYMCALITRSLVKGEKLSLEELDDSYKRASFTYFGYIEAFKEAKKKKKERQEKAQKRLNGAQKEG